MHRIAAAVNGFRAQCAVGVHGDVSAGLVDFGQHVVRVLEAVLDDRQQVGKSGQASSARCRRLQMLVEHDAVGVGDHRAPTLADRRPQLPHGAFDLADQLLISALLGELFTDRAPGEVEFGGRVLGVVRVLEVHRDERGTGGEQSTESFGIHGYPGCPVIGPANVVGTFGMVAEPVRRVCRPECSR